jgi:hypothetical protein
MHTRIIYLGAFVILLAMFSPVSAAELTAQQKLLAKRAAQVDAYRQLGEQIKGLRIDSTTIVKDFVTESDEIRTQMRAFIKGMKPVDTRYYDDGTCEVDVEVTIKEIVTTLTRIVKKHYRGKRQVGTEVFEKIKKNVEFKKLTATGAGVPFPEEMSDSNFDSMVMPPAKRPAPSYPAIWRKAGPRSRLMAKRAAEVDAMRQLVERIQGLRITSETTVKDFVTESDVIRTAVSGILRGQKTVAVRFLDDGICEVDMQVTIEEIITIMKTTLKKHFRGDRLVGQDIARNIRDEYKRKIVRATGAGTFKPGKPEPRNWVEHTKKVTTVKEEKPEWAARKIRATGQGVAPDDAESEAHATLAAKNAAKTVALRNLAEKINGVHITAETTVKDFVTQSDEIRTEFEAFLRGVTVIRNEPVGDGSWECEVEISLDSFYDIYIKHKK